MDKWKPSQEDKHRLSFNDELMADEPEEAEETVEIDEASDAAEDDDEELEEEFDEMIENGRDAFCVVYNCGLLLLLQSLLVVSLELLL